MTRLFAVGVLLAASAAFSSAQVAEFGLGGGVSNLQGKELAPGTTLDNGWSLIFRITLNSETIFGQEFGYNYNRTSLVFDGQPLGGMAIHQGFYNFLVYATPEGKRVRPFVAGGAHFSNFVPPGASATRGGGENKFGVNYGAGVKVRVTEKYLFRVDFKQFVTGKPFGDFIPVSGALRQNQISAGISFAL